MGEHRYRVIKHELNVDDDKEVEISFEVDSEVACLCTFPHNHKRLDGTGEVDIETLRSLAYLGAMVSVLHNSDTEIDFRKHAYTYPSLISDEDETEYSLFIPRDLPPWIKQAIDKAVGEKGERRE